MNSHNKHLLWYGFQLGARLAVHETGVEDSSTRQRKRIEHLKQVRDGEVRITAPEHPHTSNTPTTSRVLHSDRSLAGLILQDYLAIIDETLHNADEFELDDNNQ